MEYTKDLIFNVRYDEVHNTINFKKDKWTSKVVAKIKRHKMLTSFILTTMLLMIVDGILVFNFVKILGEL